MSLVRTDLAFYMIDEMPEIIGTMPATQPSKLAAFGLSAINQASAPVRKAGERFLIRLYELNPKAVRKVMPTGQKAYKHLFDQFDKMDSTGSGTEAESE